MSDAAAIEGKKVKGIRNLYGVSQTELARGMFLGPDAIRKWEQDKSRCSGPAAILLQILPCLDVRKLRARCPDIPEEFFLLVEAVSHSKANGKSGGNGNGHRR